MKIAVDAMGGDKAPRVIIDGVMAALKEDAFEIVLVGDENRINKELSRYPHYDKSRLHIVHADEIIEMHESPAISIRKKKSSSINIAVNLLKEGKADALVSAGNTGAVVCAATLFLRLLPGVSRPGIALVLPTLVGNTLLIDAGANIECKPDHLLQYAVMGDVYCRDILGKKNPTIGLLNVGEEEGKGTDIAKEAYRLLDKSHINFIGNVEGKDIYHGKSDIIVCDGFIGNVVLKVSESLAEAFGIMIKRELKKTFISKVGALLSRGAFMNLKKKTDYSERGGAWLLGVAGRCVISHGSSNVAAIKNAIHVAGEFIRNNVNEHIVKGISYLDNVEMQSEEKYE